jgi:hypothetical protein
MEMTAQIRLIKHEIIPDCVLLFENLPGRRLRPDLVEQTVAEQDAKAFARAEQTKLDLCR